MGKKKKKKNALINAAEKLLTKEENISPAATFVKRQKKLQQLLNDVNAN